MLVFHSAQQEAIGSNTCFLTMLAKLIGSTAFRLRILTRFAFPLRTRAPHPPVSKLAPKKLSAQKRCIPLILLVATLKWGEGVFDPINLAGIVQLTTVLFSENSHFSAIPIENHSLNVRIFVLRA